MPLLKSAKKALRQSKRRQIRNNVWKIKLKTAIKQAEKVKTQAIISAAYKAIDKAAKVGIITKNKAARVKSRLSRLLK